MYVKTIDYWKNINGMCLRLIEKARTKIIAKILKRFDTDLKKLNLGLKFIDGTNKSLLDMIKKKYLIVLKKIHYLIFGEVVKSGVEISDLDIKVWASEQAAKYDYKCYGLTDICAQRYFRH